MEWTVQVAHSDHHFPCAPDETKKVLDQLEAAIAAFRDKGNAAKAKRPTRAGGCHHGRLLTTAFGSALRASHDRIH